MLKIIYLGTPLFAAEILDHLLKHHYKLSLVITQPSKAQGRGQKISGSAVFEFCKKNNLEVLEVENINTESVLVELKKLAPDLILVAAFGQILKDEILKLPKLYCLNVHGSILPQWRGAAPVQRAIMNLDKKTGVTIQKMARKLDTGDILLQKEIPIDSKDTSETLMIKISHLGGEALVESIQLIENNKENFIPQKEDQATYAKKIEKEEALLNYNEKAEIILGKMLAFQPWPILETTFQAEGHFPSLRVKIFDGEAILFAGKNPGDVAYDPKNGLIVQCAENTALSLTVLQPDNRKRIDVKSFINSFRGSFPYKRVLGK